MPFSENFGGDLGGSPLSKEKKKKKKKNHEPFGDPLVVSLAVLGECLSLICSYARRYGHNHLAHVVIWTMKDYGSK